MVKNINLYHIHEKSLYVPVNEQPNESPIIATIVFLDFYEIRIQAPLRLSHTVTPTLPQVNITFCLYFVLRNLRSPRLGGEPHSGPPGRPHCAGSPAEVEEEGVGDDTGIVWCEPLPVLIYTPAHIGRLSSITRPLSISTPPSSPLTSCSRGPLLPIPHEVTCMLADAGLATILSQTPSPSTITQTCVAIKCHLSRTDNIILIRTGVKEEIY